VSPKSERVGYRRHCADDDVSRFFGGDKGAGGELNLLENTARRCVNPDAIGERMLAPEGF
jgi:hypothetical protein